SVVATRFLTFLVPVQSTLPPLMSLSGHSPIHELKASALRNLEISPPSSAPIVWTCRTLMPGMVVRSTPRMRYASLAQVESSGRLHHLALPHLILGFGQRHG